MNRIKYRAHRFAFIAMEESRARRRLAPALFGHVGRLARNTAYSAINYSKKIDDPTAKLRVINKWLRSVNRWMEKLDDADHETAMRLWFWLDEMRTRSLL